MTVQIEPRLVQGRHTRLFKFSATIYAASGRPHAYTYTHSHTHTHSVCEESHELDAKINRSALLWNHFPCAGRRRDVSLLHTTAASAAAAIALLLEESVLLAPGCRQARPKTILKEKIIVCVCSSAREIITKSALEPRRCLHVQVKITIIDREELGLNIMREGSP